jgi:hypothetical protein
MCGSTDEQEKTYNSQQQFYQELTAHYNDVFAQQQAILKAMTTPLQAIFAKGPSQRGFSDEERNAISTSTKENLATNFDNAKKALHESQAAQGSDEFLPSGVRAEQDAELAGMGAAQESSIENQVEQADWAQGRSQWQTAAGLLGGIASELNPNATAGVANQGGSDASETANTIAQAQNSIWSTVVGGLSGIAGAAVGGWTKGLAGRKPAPAKG